MKGKAMIKKLIGNDIKQNRLSAGAAVFFMTISSMLFALTVLLLSGLLGAVDSLMDLAQVPDYMQMHSGLEGMEEEEISRFAQEHKEVKEWQISPFLNLDNSRLRLGGISLGDSTQDNGLAMQGEKFDYLLDMENKIPEVKQGEVYVPAGYRSRYNLQAGDMMTFGNETLVIAGFLRDAQMNSMMASSKRFLVNKADYENMRRLENTQEEYLIEFLLHEGTDISAFSTAYGEAGLAANGPAVTRPLIRQISALSDGTMIFIIFLVSVGVLLISILCIRFMLLLQMERDRQEVGMLKILGIGKGEIRRIYFAKYLLFSVCGAGAGLFAAFLLKAPLEKQTRELYGAAPGGIGTALLSLTAVLVGEGIILLFVRGFLKKTAQISPLEALILTQEKKTGKGQSLLIGLVAAACTFMAVLPQNLYNTMSAPGFITYMGVGESELRMDVRQTEDIDKVTKELADALEKDGQVEKFSVLRTMSCTAVLENGRRSNLMVEAGDHSIFPVSFQEGTLPMEENEIALSSMNGEELGLSVGDKLCLWHQGREKVYTVCGIYSDITNGGKTAKVYGTGDESPVVWSVLCVSLKESAAKEQWMERYRQIGADVTDIGDYVKNTYGQTLEQTQLASRVSAGAALSVIGVVTMLFIRLIVEKNRYLISLHKALGFTAMDMKRVYFGKGMLPAVIGVAAGLLTGTVWGENLCGIMMKLFGGDGFRFVIDPVKSLLMTPACILTTAAAAVWIGVSEIKNVKAWECCGGKE